MTQLEVKDCIDALKEVKSRLPPDLDLSVQREFEAVLDRLERCLESADEESAMLDARKDALASIGKLVEIVTNVAELIKFIQGV